MKKASGKILVHFVFKYIKDILVYCISIFLIFSILERTYCAIIAGASKSSFGKLKTVEVLTEHPIKKHVPNFPPGIGWSAIFLHHGSILLCGRMGEHRDAAGRHGSGRVIAKSPRVTGNTGQASLKIPRVGSGHGSATNFPTGQRVKGKNVAGQTGQD